MDEEKDYKSWLKRAKSNLARAKNINKEDLEIYEGDIFLEDLCFDLQQCVEKSLKALLIYYGVNFPKTHDLAELFRLVKKHTTIKIPQEIKKASRLTTYAVITRYPSWNRIEEEKYLEALELGESLYYWVVDEVKSACEQQK